MPTVPLSQVSGVQAATAPSVRQSELGADAFGSGIAKGLNEAAAAVQGIAEHQKQVADETAAKDAINSFRDTMRAMKTNYSLLKGREAVEARDAHMQMIEDNARIAIDSAQNDSQRRMIEAHVARSREATESYFGSHFLEQGTVYQAEVNAERIRTLGESLQDGILDDVATAENLDELRAAVIEANPGKDASVIDGLVEIERSKSIVAGIRSVLRTNVGQAQALRDRYESLLTSDDRETLDAALQGRTDVEEVYRVADAAMAGVDINNIDSPEVQSRLRRVIRNAKPHLRQQIEAQIENQEADIRRTQQNYEGSIKNDADKLFFGELESGDPVRASQALAMLQQSEMWTAMDEQGMGSLQAEYMSKHRAYMDNLLSASKTASSKHLERVRKIKSIETRFDIIDAIDRGEITEQSQFAHQLPLLTEPGDVEKVMAALQGRTEFKQSEVDEALMIVSGVTKKADLNPEVRAAFSDWVRDQINERGANDQFTMRELARKWMSDGYVIGEGTVWGDDNGVTFGEAVMENRMQLWRFSADSDDRKVLGALMETLGYGDQAHDHGKQDDMNTRYLQDAIVRMETKGIKQGPGTIYREVVSIMEEEVFDQLVDHIVENTAPENIAMRRDMVGTLFPSWVAQAIQEIQGDRIGNKVVSTENIYDKVFEIYQQIERAHSE